MKIFKVMFMLIVLTLVVGQFAQAEEGLDIRLKNGTIISTKGLNSADRSSLMTILGRTQDSSGTSEVVAAGTSEVVAAVKEAVGDGGDASTAKKIDEWKTLIVSTVKDVCKELNVTVNEFVKTPVGIGVAAIILYKVAGNDALEIAGHIFNIILVIPLWLIVLFILNMIRKKFLASITVYDKIIETTDDKGKIIITKTGPEQECVYNWNSADARCGLAIFIICAALLMTFTMLVIIFG